MKAVDFLFAELQARYGSVTRARGMFLYTEKGVRLVDLYREGGRAILGWGGSGKRNSAFTALRDTLSRGLTGSFNTVHYKRLQKAVCTLLQSERTVYSFLEHDSALKAALSAFPQGTAAYDPFLRDASWQSHDAVLIDPPLAWGGEFSLLAVKDTLENELVLAHAIHNWKTVRPNAVLCAAFSRAIYDIIQAKQSFTEKDFFIYDTALKPYWTRRGPYLYIKKEAISYEKYTDFIRHCLDCKIVINPFYERHSIVPFGADKGVFSLLKKAPFSKIQPLSGQD